MTNNFTGLKWENSPWKTEGHVMKGAYKRGKFTRTGIVDYMNGLSKDASKLKKKGHFAVAIKYKHTGWRTGNMFKIGQSANVFNPYDALYEDDDIEAINIYYNSNDDEKYTGTYHNANKSLFN